MREELTALPGGSRVKKSSVENLTVPGHESTPAHSGIRGERKKKRNPSWNMNTSFRTHNDNMHSCIFIVECTAQTCWYKHDQKKKQQPKAHTCRFKTHLIMGFG